MTDRATHIALTTAGDMSDLNPLRALWCAVLFESLREALGIGANTRVAPWAHLWPGSRDFCEVCDLAGIDADRVFAFYEKCRDDAEFARERLSIKNADMAGQQARRRRA